MMLAFCGVDVVLVLVLFLLLFALLAWGQGVVKHIGTLVVVARTYLKRECVL